MNRRYRYVRLAIASVLAAASSLVGLGWAVSAQPPRHEIELVAGSCEAPDGPVTVLGALSSDAVMADAPVEMEAIVQALGSAVSGGQVRAPISLQDITATAHAVRVIERGRPPGRLVACGEFEGSAGTVRDLQVGLAGLDGSGLYGVAWLHDNGDGTTGASYAIAAQSSLGTSLAGSANVEVAIRKSLYVPNPLEVEVGTTVTWINEDVLPHTTTATEGGFDSGYMPLDARFSHTFDEAGEYPIFCLYHPRMRSVVIVS